MFDNFRLKFEEQKRSDAEFLNLKELKQIILGISVA